LTDILRFYFDVSACFKFIFVTKFIFGKSALALESNLYFNYISKFIYFSLFFTFTGKEIEKKVFEFILNNMICFYNLKYIHKVIGPTVVAAAGDGEPTQCSHGP